ncbi:MAG: DoxX family protein, partial [Fimbriimonadaceae bacterium]|nr:DoxX family protein [Chitinophagales bacterium]
MKQGLLWLIRILVGALFIFSGLIKANDPVGFAIKLDEYFELFAEAGSAFAFFKSEWLLNSTVVLASFICVLEVALGVCLIIGLWGRLVAWLLLLMMLFFTWLTGYSAITGKVTDCGCFGDAIPLTPWESFYKDIILTILILFIFALRKHIKPMFNNVFGFALFFAASAFTIWVTVHVQNHDVFKDFRPYAVGENIRTNMEIPADAPKGIFEMKYVYKNTSTGATEEIKMRTDEDTRSAMDRITSLTADKNWQFVERIDKTIKKPFTPKISDFAVINEEEEDITEKVLNFDEFVFMVVSPDLKKTNIGAWEKINAVQKSAEEEGIFTFALASNARDEIENFRHEKNAAFPFYKGDYKVCLTIIRTNPGILLLKNGTIVDKWAWRDLPDYSEIKQQHFANRVATENIFLQNTPKELFAEGEDVLSKINTSKEPYNGFTLMDKDANDFTQQILNNDSIPVYMVLVTDMTKVTQESYGALLPIMQKLDSAKAKWFVVSVSDLALVK